ncbi:MAG TPA: hypothetical protein VH597_08520 [Verrucomicrobiae bacterium]|nr:hypothetical protein [Verrucomicrobiae bacterium]
MKIYRTKDLLMTLVTGALAVFDHSLAQAGETVTGDRITAVINVSKADAPPPPAVAVGYNTRTFGPSVGIGTNWFLFSFYGLHGGPATQNSDGSVFLPGNVAGSQYGISTAAQTKDGKAWTGIAFGGGGYFVATFSFTGGFQPGLSTWPAWWANVIEMMAPNGVTRATQWPGQASNYGDWIEADFLEYNNGTANKYGDTVHNWYGVIGSGNDVNPNFPAITVPAGFNWATPHKFGFLWVPATATTKGYATSYLDDVQVGGKAVWNQYVATDSPPPVDGVSAYSILDKYHLALILSTGTNNPMTVQSVEVWQANTNQNSINGNHDYPGH